MDSREIFGQQQQQPPPGMLMSHHNPFNQNPNAAAFMGHTSTSQAMHHYHQFSNLSSHQHQPQHHYHLQPHQQMDQRSFGFDGSSSSLVSNQQQSMRFGIEQQEVKKKRGRPRKYVADGIGNNIALGLAPTSPLPSASNSYGGDSGGGGGNANSSDPPVKRKGRPPGSGKKQLDALGGTGGVGFTPHVIEVKSGEDIAMKVMAFMQQGPRSICILSATGAVSTVMLRQDTNSNGVVKFEGQYEIISMSCSFLNSESNGTVTKTCKLSLSMGGHDGRVLGGSVAGMLVAGSDVQVIVGSFVSDGKKQKQSAGLVVNTPEPASAPANMLTFGDGGGDGPGSPRSQRQQNSGESSEENESNSPLNRGSNNNNQGLFGNSTSQPLHHQTTMPMYHLWPSHSPQ